MKKWVFLAGAVTGYVLGARAGRERYEQIAKLSRRVANLPPVQKAVDLATAEAVHLAESTRKVVGERVSVVVSEGKERVTSRLGEYVPERFRGGASSADAPAERGASSPDPSHNGHPSL